MENIYLITDSSVIAILMVDKESSYRRLLDHLYLNNYCTFVSKSRRNQLDDIPVAASKMAHHHFCSFSFCFLFLLLWANYLVGAELPLEEQLRELRENYVRNLNVFKKKEN